MAWAFMDQISKLHGMPTYNVLDRDATFARIFWKALFNLQIKWMDISTSYHP